jgi:2-dehydropantoate 2-reductase
VVNSITAALDRQYSYVVLATKAIPDVIKNSALLSPLLSPPYSLKFKQPAYVVLQNGLNVESDLYEAVAQLGNGEPHIIGTALWIAASSLDKTVVQVENHHIVSFMQIQRSMPADAI